MNATKTLTSLTLLTLPIMGFMARGDSVSFQPEEGATVEKALGMEATFYMDDMNIVIDGAEISPDMLGGAMDEALVLNMNIEVTDEYLASKDNGIVSLRRTYDGLSFEAGGEGSAENVDDFTKLEGSTVAFKWDTEIDEFVKTFHESEGDEKQLEGLQADMDLLQLLPDGEVSEGDSWEAKGKGLLTVFSPGGMPGGNGDAGEVPELEELTELFKEELGSQFEEILSDFAIKCTYTGSEEVDGVELGAIEIEYAGEAEVDLTELILAVIELQGEQLGGMEADLTAIVGLELEGTGLLLWNMKAGHVHSFTMKNEMITTIDLDGDVDVMGESHSFEIALEVSGETAMTLTSGGSGEEE